MYLHRRKSVQSLHNGLVGYFQGFLNGFALYHLGCHTAGCYCSAAAEGFEFTIPDDTVVVDVKVDSHDIAAFCVADRADTAGILDLTDISRMLEMIHNFI